MKIDCLKKQVDLNKIHYAIDCFRAEHREYPSYIVMNYETRSEIINNNPYCLINADVFPNVEKIFGISIAYNKELKFGEVDIV